MDYLALLLRVSGPQLREVFSRTFHQIWGALLVGVFIFGLAYVFNYSGMAASLANGFSKIGPWFVVVAPILGWIGVALSGSNTSTNAMFGAFQAEVGKLLGIPTAAAADTEFGGSGDRQADRAPDGERGCFDQPICAR